MTWILLVIAIAQVLFTIQQFKFSQKITSKWQRDMEIAEIYLTHNKEQWGRTVQGDTISVFNRLRDIVAKLEDDAKAGVIQRLDFEMATDIRNKAQTLAREMTAMSTVIIQAMDKISAEVKP
jgi:biopolymer transport protein ExbB/TolQ